MKRFLFLLSMTTYSMMHGAQQKYQPYFELKPSDAAITLLSKTGSNNGTYTYDVQIVSDFLDSLTPFERARILRSVTREDRQKLADLKNPSNP